MSYIGVRVPRREDEELLTGAARTVADLSLPGLVELAFVRSTWAHARLGSVDTRPALEVPGVVAVWAVGDLPPALRRLPGTGDDAAERPVLADGRVRYVGEPIAVVAATSRTRAEDGAERVEVDVEPLPALTTAAAALAPEAPALFDDRGERGNLVLAQELGGPVDDVFDGAPVVVEAAYREQLLLPTPLEPRGILVAPAPVGDGAVELTVWASHQAQHRLRDALAGAFELQPDRVRVVVPATGGAFGTKSQIYPEYLVVAALARELGRPVRWCEDRAEAITAATRGRGQDQRARLAATEDGRFLAYELLIDADVGGYPQTGAGVPTMTAAMATGAYRTPRAYARVRSVLTTTPPTSAYRGAGRPEAAYAIERTVDQLARRLRMDPAELRRRNFVRPAEFPYQTPTGRTYDSGDYAAALDLALAEVGYPELRAEQARRCREGGRPLGVGMATYVERSGGAPGSVEYGGVEACPDGTFRARCGSTPTGQGHRTVFAQVVASALGVDLDRVVVVSGDTGEVPEGYGTFGSRSLQVGGSSLWQAAEALIEEGRRRYAAEFGVRAEEVSYDAGRLRVGEGGIDLGELARRTGRLAAERRFASPQAFPFGAYVAVVEVDPELGTVEVQRLVAVDDHGVVVNPLIVEGQRHGAIAQGLGQALFEEATYDGEGRPRQRTLLDYLLPTAADMPPITLLETHTPNPNTPLRAKGAGEAGCIGTPPAVVNAVCDAIDVDHIDMPLTPERVWRALQTRRG